MSEINSKDVKHDTSLDENLRKASKRHCWPNVSLAEAYESGFLNGAHFVSADIMKRSSDEMEKYKNDPTT
jgi:hypothetical protein